MDKRLATGLALAGSLVIGSLFIGGDDEPISGSYRGGYYSSAGSYRGGSESPWTGETKTIMFVMDKTLSVHQLAEYNADYAAADTIIELGTEATEFAYALIDSNHLGISSWCTDANNDSYLALMPTESSSWKMTTFDGTNDPQMFMTYIDWDEYIPRGATIVSAEMGVAAASWANALRDSMSSTLMSEANDDIWMTSTGVEAGSDAGIYMSHASYTYQIFREAASVNGYPSGSLDPAEQWYPALKDRDYFWDHSNWTSWSGGHPGAPYSGYYGIDITRPVQGAVNGETNHGIMTMFRETLASAVYKYFRTFEPRTGLGNEDYAPWFVVKYIDRPYAAPLPGGKDFAFVFTAYDGNNLAYDEYADAYAGRDGKFTVYIMKYHKTSGRFTFETMKDWVDADIEVSMHDGNPRWIDGAWENEEGQFTYWHEFYTIPTLEGTTSTFYQDSLKADIDSEWMYEWADEYDGDRRESEPLFAKGIGLPQGQWSPEVMRVLCDYGYQGMSFTNLLTPNSLGIGDFNRPANFRPDKADTLRYFTFPSDGGRAKNMRVVAFTRQIQTIVGEKTNTTITEAEVRFNMKMEIQRTLAQGQNVVAMFTHDLKTNPQGGDYAEGLDKEELDWMLLEVDANNGCTMTVLGNALWNQQWATPVVNPFADSVLDTFQYYTADDRVWYVPDGMDGRFIRGLRYDPP